MIASRYHHPNHRQFQLLPGQGPWLIFFVDYIIEIKSPLIRLVICNTTSDDATTEVIHFLVLFWACTCCSSSDCSLFFTTNHGFGRYLQSSANNSLHRFFEHCHLQRASLSTVIVHVINLSDLKESIIFRRLQLLSFVA
ncbi:hypothetical protein FOBRF1_006179 [Fusarium oxysporum]